MPIPTLLNKGGLVPSLVSELETTVSGLEDSLFDVQLALHERPEIAWEEHFAHQTCSDFMERQGFTVTRHAFGLATAWSAVFEVGQGGPTVGFNSEMDALKGIGHACGHNLIAIAGMAAAIATAKLLAAHNIAGKVVLLGTPAEEAGGGKSYLLKRGAYDGMDVCLMTHPMPRGYGAALPSMACNASFSVQYHGASAHAAAMPEKGVNALDAVVSAYMSLSLLRQQIPDTHRIYSTIKGSEGWTANIIASESKLIVGIRAPTARETYNLINRVLDCLKAASMSTGCRYEIHREALYLDTQHSTELSSYCGQVCTEQWGDKGYTYSKMTTYASSDFGDVTYRLPALHTVFHLPDAAADDFPHSDTFASSTGSRSATQAALQSAVSLAAVGCRAVLDRKWTASVREAWEKQMEAIDGPKVLSDIEALMDSYPLSEAATQAVCCGH